MHNSDKMLIFKKMPFCDQNQSKYSKIEKKITNVIQKAYRKVIFQNQAILTKMEGGKYLGGGQLSP